MPALFILQPRPQGACGFGYARVRWAHAGPAAGMFHTVGRVLTGDNLKKECNHDD